MSASLVQNEQSQTAFYHLCKMESAFAAVWIFCVLAHNCEADKILCTPSNRSGLKKIKLNQKESLLLSVVPDRQCVRSFQQHEERRLFQISLGILF